MNKDIKRYRPGELLIIKNNLDKKEKKILDDYITFLSGSASENKVKVVERQLLMIRDNSKVPFDNWDLEKLRQFLALLNKSDLAEATKNDIKKHFKRFIKEQYDDWNQRFKALKDIKLGKDLNVEKLNANTILQPTELEKLIRTAENLKYKALIITLYETGGRPTEVLSLKWKDVDLDKKEVKLISTKNNTARVIPLNESVLHLKRYYQEYPYSNVTPNDYVFPSPRDRKAHFSIQYLQTIFGRISKRALGRKIFPYILRHSRATELQKKLTAKVYERVMDHSIEMASRYSHLNKDDIKEEMLEKVYHIEEITKEDNEKIKKLEDDLNLLKKSFHNYQRQTEQTIKKLIKRK